MEPIAIVGLAFKLPQEAVDEASLWEVLQQRRNLMTTWPKGRAAVESFYDGGSKKLSTMHARGAHFLKEDPAVFDAPFFSITSKEAAAMDPQQRWVLETAYHAFENAGIPVEQLRGSRTAVFGASMADDYLRLIARDPDNVPRMVTTGAEPSILPNRVSWYFNLRGPSIHINTACSSSLVALDQACQSLRNRNASAALVFGSSMLLGPELSTILSNMNFLSPDGLCYSFDHRASGYSRGEGTVAIVLKPLAQALHDGDVVRAVIRATGSNSDGRTPGLTQPSAEAQEMLIRDVYQKAGLSFKDTRYVEAHGTGTPIGDPIEIKAIGRVFGESRSPQNPLYVGSIKSNVGHLEGASGLAGLVKAVLALEKGTIPPNALFEKINPALEAERYHIRIPTESIGWPTEGIRRASVNSFGFGGTNAHVILDGALHYLRDRGLIGYQNCTVPSPSSRLNSASVLMNGVRESTHNAFRQEQPTSLGPRLLVWTAADTGGLDRLLGTYQSYYQNAVVGRPRKLNQLAYTLAERRSHMPWRSFAVLGDTDDKITTIMKPLRAARQKQGVALIFTGQGAQYVGMGLELMQYTKFADTLRRIDSVLAGLGCSWSIFDALYDQTLIDRPQYSQPLCTALQLALVELLATFNITPVIVVGHSSGEIAAAYTIGALSLESAVKVAYYRGVVAEKLKVLNASTPGAMMSVNLPENKIQKYVAETPGIHGDCVHVACVNSPLNCTLSGTEDGIDKVKLRLDADGIFAQKLKTGVAYHSPSMRSIASEYLELLGTLDEGVTPGNASVTMISSVTGHGSVAPKLLTRTQYWADNLISPVRFADAIQCLAEGKALKEGVEAVADIVEIGPHSALRRPVLDTLAAANSRIRYATVMQRSKSPLYTVLALLGTLFCHGHLLSISAANGHRARAGDDTSPPPLVDCPQYPFDHSRRYWAESRMSKSYRLREKTTGHLLGRRAHDWNELRPTFRNWLSVESMPWLADHVISDKTICPAAGMIVMALEAAAHQYESSVAASRPISGFLIKEAKFLSPILVPAEAQDSTETYLHLRPLQQAHEKESGWSEISVFAFQNDRWAECFQARIQVQREETAELQVDGGRERLLEADRVRDLHGQAAVACTRNISESFFYNFLESRGLAYGPAFRHLKDIRWDNQNNSVARMFAPASLHQVAGSPVHPGVLDAAIHLTMTQISKGLDGSTPTLVPQRISNAWISVQPWNKVDVTTCLLSDRKGTKTHGIEASMHAISDNGSPLCAFERILMVPVSQDNDAHSGERAFDTSRDLLYEVEWKPHLSVLSPKELQQLCCIPPPGPVQNNAASVSKLNSALQKAAQHALAELSHQGVDSSNLPVHLRQFVDMIHHLYGGKEDNTDDWQTIQLLLKQCETSNQAQRVCTNVGLHLTPILRGEVDALDMLFGSGASEFYESIFKDVCDARFRTFLDLAAHENPGLRIIEVGAGTGGVTSHVLGALQMFEKRVGSARFAEYTYTDISPSFFDAARAKFSDFSDRLVFKKLDLERNPGEDGFDLGAYDIVVAGAALHATSRLANTMANVRSLLKPGGRLVNIEVTTPGTAWMNVVFGTVPGWWLSEEPWREHGPLATKEQWCTLAHDSGFSGLDLCLTTDAGVSLMVSTAKAMDQVEGQNQTSYQSPRPLGLVLIIDPNSRVQKALAAHVASVRDNVRVVHVDHVHETEWAKTDVVLILLEVGTPRLAHMDEANFQLIQGLLRRSRNLVWVTAPDCEGEESQASPQYGAAAGLLRVLRSEEPTKHFVTLAIESPSKSTLGPETQLKTETSWSAALFADYVLSVVQSCYEVSTPSPEVEFTVRNGHVMSGRLIHAAELEEEWRARVQSRMRIEPLKSGPPLALDVGTPGMLDSLRFVEDTESIHNDTRTLPPGEVEILAKAWAVSMRDVFIALGRLGQEELGLDCAGIVSRVGEGTSFQPGDRVCLTKPGCMRMYPRAPAEAVLKLPDSVSFNDAVAGLNPGMTAYHALVNLARLQKEDKILIHSAAGSTGQMAVAIAKRIGAEVFATVGMDEKKQLLMDKFGIPADHIFYSRNTSFTQGIMRVTNGYGVDVVLNSLAGDGLRSSWECIAPYGRFIEIGKMDIRANTSLPMASFAKNAAFFAVDLVHIVQTNSRLMRQLVQAVMDMIADDKTAAPSPLNIYSTAEAEKAFRYMQSGRNLGRTIIEVDDNHVVPKLIVKKSNWHFDPDASYVVAGGLGGLGRVILRWMADKGAKNLIIPSRSGTSSQASRDIVSELQDKGVHTMAPKCDISSATELAALLQACTDAHMPPIKGCINAAMALHDAVFEDMTHAQWEMTIKSKVDSSWNLHQQLPQQMDFFILLSSVGGVFGTMAQANYAAGCTFQDALARHRNAAGTGKMSLSLDLGWVVDAGTVAEQLHYSLVRSLARDMIPVATTDMLAVLDIYCDPTLPPLEPEAKSQKSQLLVGAFMPAEMRKRDGPPSPFETLPLISGFVVEASKEGRKQAAQQPAGVEKVRPGQLFRQAVGNEERAGVVVTALVGRVARSLGVAAGDIDVQRPLSEYGVDSLITIELRNWIRSDFHAAVAVFELMDNGTSIAAVGNLVVERSEIKQ